MDDPHLPVAAVVAISAALLISGAVVSALEIAIITLGRLRLRQCAEDGSRAAAGLAALLEQPSRLFSTLLVVITTLNYVNETLVTEYCLAHGIGFWFPLVAMPLIVLVVAEITPILYGAQHPESVALSAGRVLPVLEKILYPVVTVLTAISNLLLRVFTGLRAGAPEVTEEEIKAAIEVAEEAGAIEEEESDMLQGIMDFCDTAVSEVMVPRVDMVVLASDDTVATALQRIVSTGRSRLPVHRGGIDNIIGVLYAKDLMIKLREGYRGTVESIVRPAVFAPETKKVDDMLADLQRARRALAIVVGPHGGTSGLVTVEDLLEEIVGDIEDEHDSAHREASQLAEDTWLLDARLSLRQVDRLTGVELPGDDTQTLSAFILERMERFPAEGDVVELDRVRMSVERMTARRIRRVLFERLRRPAPNADDAGLSER